MKRSHSYSLIARGVGVGGSLFRRGVPNGTISRCRSFDAAALTLKEEGEEDEAEAEAEEEEEEGKPGFCCWAALPPEILREIIGKIEGTFCTWPGRQHVLACAEVCRAWRDVTKDLVKVPEQSGLFTFLASLKQPGPRDSMVQCFIKRDRATATYRLFLGLTPALVENGKFLMAARKVRRATNTEYIISLDADDMSKGSKACMGKLRSNFLGTKFVVFDSDQFHGATVSSTSRASWHHMETKQVSPSLTVTFIANELNVLGTRGPRKMQCTLYSLPPATSAVEHSGTLEYSLSSLPYSSSKSASEFSFTNTENCFDAALVDGPLILKNKSPRWHEQLQCWCLNFRGRVTVASVKNFQLVATTNTDILEGQVSLQADHEKVLLQFGKVGKDLFTMDYQYPLSAFQAFAICLSSFDTKMACE